MKKKTVGYLAIAGALSFGIIGGVGIPAFAATNTPAVDQSAIAKYPTVFFFIGNFLLHISNACTL
ncbi:hypothetical protein ACT453_17025, partial [Bacillus sp. D-CC]